MWKRASDIRTFIAKRFACSLAINKAMMKTKNGSNSLLTTCLKFEKESRKNVKEDYR
jgi:hypothetical protein